VTANPTLASDMPHAGGLAVRLAYRMTPHWKPLNGSDKALDDAEKALHRMDQALARACPDYGLPDEHAAEPDPQMLALCSYPNTPIAVTRLFDRVRDVNRSGDARPLVGSRARPGLLRDEPCDV